MGRPDGERPARGPRDEHGGEDGNWDGAHRRERQERQVQPDGNGNGNGYGDGRGGRWRSG